MKEGMIFHQKSLQNNGWIYYRKRGGHMSLNEEQITKVKWNNAIATAEYYKNKFEIEKKNINKDSWLVSLSIKLNHKWNKGRRYFENKRSCRKSLRFNKNGLNRTQSRERKIIVSLTSYPARIHAVPAVIGSLLNQTLKPDEIILWLGEEKFPDRKLPLIFKQLKSIGVKIEFRVDLKSHTKYFYAIQEYPEDLIITVDDDILYRRTLVEELYLSYQKHPNCISALRVHKMRFEDDCSLKKYAEWDWDYVGEIGQVSYQYFATGVGGVLYPPHSLHPEVMNLEIIKKCCHNHDDLWLKVMEVMAGTKVVIAANSKQENISQIIGTQKTGQWRENVICGGNDRQTESVLEEFREWKRHGMNICEIMALDL